MRTTLRVLRCVIKEAIDLASIKYEITDNVSDTRNDIELTAKTNDDKEVAFILAHQQDEPKNTFYVSGTQVIKKEDRRQGLGLVMYRKLNDYVKTHHNHRLCSGTSVQRSVGAETLWKKLVQSGEAENVTVTLDGYPPTDVYVMK